MPSIRVVPPWGGLVSCCVMHLKASIPVFFALFLALSAAGRMQAQDSSSQSQPTPVPSSQGPDAQTQSYGTYIASDPLARVSYDNRWDLSLGAGYDHIKAGPNLLQGGHLGGLDL